MKSLFYKDKMRRTLYYKVRMKKNILKSIYNNFSLPNTIRIKAYFKLKTLNKNYSITRLHNRCILTNRSRSIYKNFGLSRLAFRRLALNGNLIGVKKSS
jgi:small subunit ribosomal protein S14